VCSYEAWMERMEDHLVFETCDEAAAREEAEREARADYLCAMAAAEEEAREDAERYPGGRCEGCWFAPSCTFDDLPF
jgi:hypothetical protein